MRGGGVFVSVGQDSDRRGRDRVGFHTGISLKIGESEIIGKGSIVDLSLNGVFIETNEDVPVGEKCSVKIILPGTVDKVILQMSGRTVRKKISGIAVHFDSMDIDTFTHLKNIVRYNSGSPDEVFAGFIQDY